MSRAENLALLQRIVAEHFGPGYRIQHVNHGDSHRRMLLANRRHERAYQRSRRNQPPRSTSGRKSENA